MSYNYASNNIIKEWLSSARASLSVEEDSDRMVDQLDHHLSELKAGNAISYGILEEMKASRKEVMEELQLLNSQTFANNLSCLFILCGVAYVIHKMHI